MAHAEKIDGQWIEKTLSQWNTERGSSIRAQNAHKHGLHEITVDPRPEASGKIISPGPLVDRDGRPVRTWVTRDPTPEEAVQIQERLARNVKRECEKRILAVADANTQSNIAQAGVIYSALRLNGVPEADALAQAGFIEGDLTIAATFRGWVSAMSSTHKSLIETGDEAYQDDAKWPDVPAGVADLAARF